MPNYRAIQAKDPLHRLFDEASLALALLDTSGFVVEANTSFKRLIEALFGQTLEDSNEALPELFRSHDAYRFSFHFSRLTTGLSRSMVLDTAFRKANGEYRWLHLAAWAITELPEAESEQQGPFIALTIKDNTERRQEERKLLAAKEQAERTMETKGQFLANISHEIRTPIQTIVGMMELLQETRLDSEQAEYSKQVKFSADVLLSLVNDILDYSKIEADRLLLESIDFDLDSLVEGAVDLVCMEAHKKSLEVTVDIAADAMISIRGDLNRLRQVIVNLVKNAVKFTQEGGIIVSVRTTLYEGQSALTIAVTDTGIGVAAELRPRLFSTFFQADASTTRRFGGTGLGLAISKQLVGLMGGVIAMEPNEPNGAIFQFTIPVDQRGLITLSIAAPLLEGIRVLVVDDSLVAGQALIRFLQDLGFVDAEMANSGDQALSLMRLAAAEGRPYKLCLIDMIMPAMDGWRLASAINKDREINAAKLILMIPQGTLGADAKMTLLRWFNANVNKPIKKRELSEIITNVLITPLDLEITNDESDDEVPTVKRLPTPVYSPAQATARPISAVSTVKKPIYQPESSEKIDVLVVEDHEVNQRLFTLILDRLGCQSHIANDGLEALEAVAAQDYKVIFMDIQMPRMNGYEAAKRLRESGYNGPIIAVTAGVLEAERKHCLDVGMNDILTKPFKRVEVETMLQKALAMPPFPLPVAPLAKSPVPTSDKELMSRKASELSWATPEKCQIFDPAAVLENFLGHSDTVMSLLKGYIERCDDQLVKLPDLIQAAAWTKVDMAAHSIKGSALNLCANQLAAAAAELEKAAKAESAVGEKFQALTTAYQSFRKLVMDFITEQESLK